MIIQVSDFRIVEALEWLRDSGVYRGEVLDSIKGHIATYREYLADGRWRPRGETLGFNLTIEEGLEGDVDVTMTPRTQMLFKLMFAV